MPQNKTAEKTTPSTTSARRALSHHDQSEVAVAPTQQEHSFVSIPLPADVREQQPIPSAPDASAEHVFSIPLYLPAEPLIPSAPNSSAEHVFSIPLDLPAEPPILSTPNASAEHVFSIPLDFLAEPPIHSTPNASAEHVFSIPLDLLAEQLIHSTPNASPEQVFSIPLDMETEEENHYSLSPLHPNVIPDSLSFDLEELLQTIPVPSTLTPSLGEDTTHQPPPPSQVMKIYQLHQQFHHQHHHINCHLNLHYHLCLHPQILALKILQINQWIL